MSPPWKPAIDGPLRERALARVRTIAEAVGPYSLESKRADALKVGLFSGHGGLAVFFAAVTRAGLFDGTAQADASLDRCLHAAAEESLDASLEGGLSGIGFALQNVTQDPSAAEDLDEVLLGYLQGEAAPGSYELLSGLVGFGAYALERGEPGMPVLRRVVEHLDVLGRTARTDERRYLVPPTMLGDDVAKYPHGIERTGLAHGVAGIVGFLSAAAPHFEKARELVPKVTRGLLALGDAATRTFPDARTGTESRALTNYDAWCNGTSGVACALSAALEHLPPGVLREETLAYVNAALDHVPTPEDMTICHGTAGLGLMALRMHQRHPDARTAARVKTYVEQTLAHAEQGGQGGIGGLLAYRPWLEEKWVADPALGGGSAGAALFLLAAATDQEPTWGRMLGLG